MSNAANTPAPKTRTLETGINGSGAPVWIVHTAWTSKVNGRELSAREIFDTEAEAQAWLKYA